MYTSFHIFLKKYIYIYINIWGYKMRYSIYLQSKWDAPKWVCNNYIYIYIYIYIIYIYICVGI